MEVDNSLEVKIGNEKLKRVNYKEYKEYLGVVIDERSTLKEQTAIHTKKSSKQNKSNL